MEVNYNKNSASIGMLREISSILKEQTMTFKLLTDSNQKLVNKTGHSITEDVKESQNSSDQMAVGNHNEKLKK